MTVHTQLESAKKGHVVVIDDDQELLPMIADFLSSNGYKVTAFTAAQDALESFAKHKDTPDLIISDLRMPQVNGLEFLRQLKSTASQVPVILMTAFASIESAMEASQGGAYDYIVKPFKPTEICYTIDRAIDYGRLSRENFKLKQDVNALYEGLKHWNSLDKLVDNSNTLREIYIPLLAEYFRKKYCIIHNPKVAGFTRAAMHKLMNTKWDDNLKEFESAVERAVIVCANSMIEESDIPSIHSIS